MASGAQLNRWGNSGGVAMLTLNSAATAVALPSFGTLGVNDSGAFITPIGMQTWTFLLIGAGTGYTVTLLGSIDPTLYVEASPSTLLPLATAVALGVPATNYSGKTDPFIPVLSDANSWAPLPGPSEQSGTGASQNPITASGIFFQAKIALVAVRAVLTASASAAGSITVVGFAVP